MFNLEFVRDFTYSFTTHQNLIIYRDEAKYRIRLGSPPVSKNIFVLDKVESYTSKLGKGVTYITVFAKNGFQLYYILGVLRIKLKTRSDRGSSL